MQSKEVHQNFAAFTSGIDYRKGPISLQDNAGPHVATATPQRLYELGYEIFPHPTY